MPNKIAYFDYLASMGQNDYLLRIVRYHDDDIEALKVYFELLKKGQTIVPLSYVGYTPEELDDTCDSQLSECELGCVFLLFAYIEALFQNDCKSRVVHKLKHAENLSQRLITSFACKYSNSQPIPILGILKDWISETPIHTGLLNELRQGFRYIRHWFAHGRYWHPKPKQIDLQKYTFQYVYTLAEEVRKNIV